MSKIVIKSGLKNICLFQFSKVNKNCLYFSDSSNDSKNTSDQVKIDSNKITSESQEKSLLKEKQSKEVTEPEQWVPYQDRLEEVKNLAPWEDGYDKHKDPDLHSNFLIYDYPQMFYREGKGIKRIKKTIKSDLSLVFKEGRIARRPDEIPVRQSDILIFGGGIIGSSIAYFLKERLSRSVDVTVIDKDITYNSNTSTLVSLGGIKQQFSLKENILMAMESAEFYRNTREAFKILDEIPPDIKYHPQGYLTLANEKQADQLIQDHKTQIDSGAFVDILPSFKIEEKFPWLNINDIVLATYGVQNEGLIDPYHLLLGFRLKAEWLGARYLQAEIIGFNKKTWLNSGHYDETGGFLQNVNHVIVREPDGEVKQIEFGVGIVACGAASGQIAKMAGIGIPKSGLRSIPCPVEPRKRYVYMVNTPDGPGIDMPVILDPSGVYCMRDGLGGNYLCGKSPSKDQEPDVSNLDVDPNFFDEQIGPVLANRIEGFETVKLEKAWAGYYDYNYYDQCPLIGQHPYFPNLLWATGFSNYGISVAPAVGMAIMEMYVDKKWKTIDMSRLGWERLIYNVPLRENYIY